MDAQTYILWIQSALAINVVIALISLVFAILYQITLDKSFKYIFNFLGLLAFSMILSIGVISKTIGDDFTQERLKVVVTKVPEIVKIGVISKSRDISIFTGKDTISNVVVRENQSMPLIGDTIEITKDLTLAGYSYFL